MASNTDELIYIYIVDSDEFQQKRLRTSFLEAKTNYILRPYSSGEKFMDNLLLNPPPKKSLSVVIVDLNLNNNKQAINGMNVLYRTKELHPEFIIIMVSETNENFENNKIEALNAGAISFFKKNDNVYLRVKNIIKGIISKKKLSKKKESSRSAFVGFLIVLFGLSTFFLLLYKFVPNLFYF